MPGLIEAFADAELAYRQERIRAEFRPLRPRRWLAGLFNPAKRRPARPALPGPARPAPHHLRAAN